MAVKLPLTGLSNGLEFLEAYGKVHSAEMRAISRTATVSLYWWKDHEARQSGK